MKNFNSEFIVDSFVNRVRPIRGRYAEFCTQYGIDYSWLSKFVNGRITNPRIDSLQVLDRAIQDWESKH